MLILIFHLYSDSQIFIRNLVHQVQHLFRIAEFCTLPRLPQLVSPFRLLVGSCSRPKLVRRHNDGFGNIWQRRHCKGYVRFNARSWAISSMLESSYADRREIVIM